MNESGEFEEINLLTPNTSYDHININNDNNIINYNNIDVNVNDNNNNNNILYDETINNNDDISYSNNPINNDEVNNISYDTVNDDEYYYIDSNDPTIAATPVHCSSYSIPNQQSIASGDMNPLPMGLLVSPAVSLQPPLPQIERSPQQCKNCGALLNTYCPILPNPASNTNSSIWQCNFCNTKNIPSDINNSELIVDLYNYERFPELTRKVVEHIEVGNSPIINAVPYIFVVDAHTTKDSMLQLVNSLNDLLSTLPEDSYIGLIVFSNTVSVYQITKYGAIANTISGLLPPSDDDLDFLFEREHDYQQPTFTDRMELNNNVAPIIGPIRECQNNVLDCLRAIAATARNNEDEREKLLNPRCIGPAIETAMAMAGLLHIPINTNEDSNESNNESIDNNTNENKNQRHQLLRILKRKHKRKVPGGHIILCTTGPPDIGPGSVSSLSAETEELNEALEYFDHLGRQCHDSFITVNVFCAGMTNFAVPQLRKLTDRTGGTISIYQTFDQNFSIDLTHRLFMACGYNGIFTIRTSNTIGISRIIGGVNELLQHTVKNDAGTATTVIEMSSVYPHECLSLYYNVIEDIPDDYIYFQLTLTYNDMQHNHVTRSINVRVRTTGNFQTYLQSVDVNVLSVLIAKRSVLMATRSEFTIQEVLDDLDEQVKEIGQQFGHEVVSENSVRHELLQEIQILPKMLYLLRRGPLLGPILQHSDDIDAVRSIFLKANISDSLRLIAPHLLSFDSQGQFEQLPLEILALQSGRILMLDHHTHIFIWSGRYVIGTEYDAYRDACVQRVREICVNRIPAPEVLLFNEGSSQARWLICRLIPSHKDSRELQYEAFPQLRSFTEEQREELLSKFLPTDEPSFYEYYQKLVFEK